MKRTSTPLLPLLLALTAVTGQAQAPQPQPPPLVSPEVHSDRSAIFRFRAPNAKEVSLAREGTEPQPMHKDEQGVWSVTTDPLEPDLYGYAFVADGVSLIDPSNPLIKPNPFHTESVVMTLGYGAEDRRARLRRISRPRTAPAQL